MILKKLRSGKWRTLAVKIQGKPENIAKFTPETEKRDRQACLNGVFLSQHQRGCRLQASLHPLF
ncbi:hypothetical protein [Porcincola intestinalis]|nr:hypothetical protein [Porcincola intestinalis]MCI6698729.1 hypothetical protein [Lachnospiraceae bacterium]MDY5580206.1 hypothetical protein [Porcincola intestinalis]